MPNVFKIHLLGKIMPLLALKHVHITKLKVPLECQSCYYRDWVTRDSDGFQAYLAALVQDSNMLVQYNGLQVSKVTIDAGPERA